MDEPKRYPTWPPDLRGPLHGGAKWHPSNWALPATLLSFGSAAAALVILLGLDLRPDWRPSPLLGGIFATLSALISWAVVTTGRHRAGPTFPRFWALSLTLVSGGLAGVLCFSTTDLADIFSDLAIAALGAALALTPRLGPRQLTPHDRRLESIGLIGPIIGIGGVVLLRLLGGMAVEAWDALRASELRMDKRAAYVQQCQALEPLLRQNLSPVILGGETKPLELLTERLRALQSTSESWPEMASAEPAIRKPCVDTLALLESLWAGGSLTPGALIRPAFRHRARPQRAGEPSKDLPTQTEPTCRLHSLLNDLTQTLTIRLESAAPEAAEALLEARRARLESLRASWLDGWLRPCVSSQSDPVPDLELRLSTPPGLEAGRPDQWLTLSLAEAELVAQQEPACALRGPYKGRSRRWQVLDCVALAPSDAGLELVLELGLVYASPERDNPRESLRPLAKNQLPFSARLLAAVPRGEDDTTYDKKVIEVVRRVVEAAGGHFKQDSQNPWKFQIDQGTTRLTGSVSAIALPGKRRGIAVTLSAD